MWYFGQKISQVKAMTNVINQIQPTEGKKHRRTTPMNILNTTGGKRNKRQNENILTQVASFISNILAAMERTRKGRKSETIEEL